MIKLQIVFLFLYMGLRACLTEKSVLCSPVMCNVIPEWSENNWTKWVLTIYSITKWYLLHFFFLTVSLISFFSLSKALPVKICLLNNKDPMSYVNSRPVFLKNSGVKVLLTALWSPSNNVSCASLFLGRTSVVHFSYADICCVPFCWGIVRCFVHDTCFHLSSFEW